LVSSTKSLVACRRVMLVLVEPEVDEAEAVGEAECEEAAGLRWIMKVLVELLIKVCRNGLYKFLFLKCFYEFQHFLCVPRDFHAAPLSTYYALGVNCKRTTLDATHFFTVHVFHFNDIERFASDFFDV